MSRTWIADLALAAAAVLLLAAPAVARDTLGLAVVDTLDLAEGELRGLTWLENDTLVVLVAFPAATPGAPDSVASLRWLDDEGAVLREHDVTGLLSRGLAYDGKWFWSLGDQDAERPATLYKIESDTLFVDEAYPTPGHRPRDLAWADDGLWLVDRDRGRLDRFDPEAEEVTRSHPTPGFSPAGVAWDGSSLWVSDAATGLLYRLNGRGTVWTGTVRSEDCYLRGAETALVWRGEELWLLPPRSGRAVRVRMD